MKISLDKYFKSAVLELAEAAPSLLWTGSCRGSANTTLSTSSASFTRCARSVSGWFRLNSNTFASTRSGLCSLLYARSDLNRFAFKPEYFSNCSFQCLLTVLEGKEHDERHERQLHDNEAFEDDEGIAESGM